MHELQLANHALILLKIMELVKIALEAPTLLEGLANSRSNAIATFLVSTLRTIGTPIRCSKYHRFYYNLEIGVAALTLSMNGILDRMSIL